MRQRTITPVDALASVPLFAGLSASDAERLAAALRARRYTRGETILLEGDVGASLGIIADGRVKITLTDANGREVVLNVYGPGEFFGEFALLDGEPRSANAIAQDACLLYWLHRDDFLGFLDAHPRAAATLLAVLSRRLRHTTRIVQEAAFRDVSARLARTILTLAEEHGRSSSSGIVVDARLTQSELAALVGASRETVNRSLRGFEDLGLLQRRRGRIVIVDAPALRRRASAQP
ncbi:MAG: Crp/Fnr family transcriptional regulator [Chloroflexi bacterium]|nr:Crp/Fnr family transcriptional regulator [Chloroflexota bacterium]